MDWLHGFGNFLYTLFGWLGPLNWTSLILIASSIIAYFSLKNASASAKKRATVDLALHEIRDRSFHDASVNARKALRAENPSQHIQNKDSDEFKSIVVLLNHYEFVAVGIRSGAFDEDMYKYLRYTSVMKDYDSAEGFIAQARINSGSQTVFQEFEWMACRFRKSPLKKKVHKITSRH